MKTVFLSFFILFLSSCATLYQPIPEGYSGEISTIKDSNTNKSHFFMLYKINDQFIEHSWSKTRAAHYGQGFRYDPIIVSRDVMAIEQKFTLHGLVFFPTDGQAMFGDDMGVKKDFIFTPKPNETYTVRGELSKPGSKVWLEDSSGNMVEGSLGETVNK